MESWRLHAGGNLRQDIQFLRGIAVLFVVFQHAAIGPTAGYLGVDIFFVISGFLITRIIQRGMEDGTFRFSEFYARRAKRLLPAALTTFALTALAAPYFLGSLEMDGFKEQLVGALTFTANMVLYGQSGYFESEASLKPLLHIWSLSLEEQYYFILPALMLLTPLRFWTQMMVGVLIGSFALCMFFLSQDPDFAFYSLPTRAWELGIGSLVALLRLDIKKQTSFVWAFWPGLVLVLLVPFFPTSSPHPAIDAMLVCFGTAVIIINNRTFFAHIFPLKAIAWVGNASYSIYLIHWPIMVFINAAYLIDVPLETRLASIVMSLIAGIAIYYLIERPFHNSTRQFSLPAVLGGAAVASAIIAAPLHVQGSFFVGAANSSSLDFSKFRRANYGLGRACDLRGGPTPPKECTTGGAPTVLLWGDSLAMHLAQGIQAADKFDFYQLALSSCPPAIGFAQFNNRTKYPEEWAKRCVSFNRNVVNFLRHKPEIETVVMGSTFRAFLADEPWEAIVQGPDGEYERVSIEEARSLQILHHTVRTLRALGKRVVIFAPPPVGGMDYSECIERKLTGKIILGVSSCAITVADDQQNNGAVLRLLHSLRETANVEIIDPRHWMCSQNICETIRDGVPLYRDTRHLSAAGSSLLGITHQWGDRIIDAAR